MTRQRKAKRPTNDRVLNPKRLRTDDVSTRIISGEGLLELQEGEVLEFSGQAKLTVEDGAILIDGYHAKTHTCTDIHADAQIGGRLCMCMAPGKQQPPVPLAAETKAVLRIESLTDQSESCNPSLGFHVLRKTLENAAGGQQPPEAWLQVVEAIAQETAAGASGCFVVVGTKGIGKSTFARLLVNTLLEHHPKVAYLDTDLGQPEFTVPGLISLHFLEQPVFGAPHMHQRQPEACFFLGDVSPQGDPLLCAQAVRLLCSRHLEQGAAAESSANSFPPLVVNTNGWIQGVGLDFLRDTLQIVSPTHVIKLESKSVRRNLPADVFWPPPESQPLYTGQIVSVPGIGGSGTATSEEGPTTTEPTITLPGQSSPQHGHKLKSLPAIELRGLAWLAFIRRCCALNLPPDYWDASAFASAALSASMQTPYTVSFNDVKIQVLHTHIAKAQLAGALNGSIVSLASTRLAALTTHAESVPAAHKGMLECLGMGLVRAVDAEQGLLYMLTDMSPNMLEQVDTLQVGKQSLPPSLLQTATLASPYLSFGSLNSGGSGSGVIKSRNTLARASGATPRAV